MKTVLIAAALALASWSAAAQPAEPPSYAVQMTDAEIEVQARLNNIACKTVGLDDGGQTCDFARALNGKYVKAKQPAAKTDPPKP